MNTTNTKNQLPVFMSNDSIEQTLANIKGRLTSILPKSGEGADVLTQAMFNLKWLSNNPFKDSMASIFYPNGNYCAKVKSEYSLELNANHVAEFFANSASDINYLLKLVDDLQQQIKENKK